MKAQISRFTALMARLSVARVVPEIRVCTARTDVDMRFPLGFVSVRRRVLLVVIALLLSSIASPSQSGEYVSPSTSVPLKEGQKISNLYATALTQPYIVQRLTDRTYWVQAQFYCATVVVGKEGIMVVDPLGFGAGAKLLKAIRSISSLPISTLVYSHYHLDHLKDVAVFIEEEKRQQSRMEIVATTGTARAIERHGNKVPMPTKVLNEAQAEFSFEGIRVQVITPALGGHTPDNAIIYLPEEKVVHYADLINPDQVPFLDFGNVQDFGAFVDNLRTVNRMEWQFMNAGHGNIGSHADIDFNLQYFEDIIAAIRLEQQQVRLSHYLTMEAGSHIKAFHTMRAELQENVRAKLAPKYGKVYGFNEGVLSHVRVISAYIGLH